jgi:voltage-gated sodium channel
MQDEHEQEAQDERKALQSETTLVLEELRALRAEVAELRHARA